ncbi:MAG: hypothetical protein CM15mP45_06150 [Deltaproteobacteria bacterium]|nr:MAG: hypothetical protein CM15mP45_06150 [Deltaproteobacteria bacterium]
MLAGIRDILIITTPEQQKNFKNLPTMEAVGIKLSYGLKKNQRHPPKVFKFWELLPQNEPFIGLGKNSFLETSGQPYFTPKRLKFKQEGGNFFLRWGLLKDMGSRKKMKMERLFLLKKSLKNQKAQCGLVYFYAQKGG